MKWVVDRLQEGETVSFKPRGNSMAPLIHSGDLVKIRPVSDINEVVVGSVVLCKVKGNIYLHKVTAVGDKGFQISNNKGFVNGWTRSIYGVMV